MSSTVKGILQQLETFSMKWKIDRFFADCQGIGDYYQSPMFSVKCTDKIAEWYLKVYPRGEKEEDKDYVSLFLCFKSDIKIEVIVDFQFSIVSEQNKRAIINGKSTKNFEHPSTSWGWPQFIDRSIIEDMENKILINDTLIILCELKFDSITQDAIAEILHDYSRQLAEIKNGFSDYERILESGIYTDVTFVVQDKKMHLHKAILSCRSLVFATTFVMEHTQNVIEIRDFDYEVMKELFRFLYSGKVKNIEQIASDLLIAAEKYQVIKLKVMCEKTLYDQLTVDNSIDCLKLTDKVETIHLRQLVIKFLAANYRDVIKKPDFVNLDSNVMFQIIQFVAESN